MNWKSTSIIIFVWKTNIKSHYPPSFETCSITQQIFTVSPWLLGYIEGTSSLNSLGSPCQKLYQKFREQSSHLYLSARRHGLEKKFKNTYLETWNNHIQFAFPRLIYWRKINGMLLVLTGFFR